MILTTHKLENITVNYQGDHSGIASIDWGPIAVVSMGPHYFPLGELSRYGIYREGGDFSDIEESSTSISGWSKLIACDRSFGSGATWIYFSAEKKQNEIRISTAFENGKGEDPFAFVFFVKAKEIKISEKRYLRGGLASYQGMNSPLELICEHEKVVLTPQFKGPIQIIPLAGGDYFWGGDFLIAFEIHDLDFKYGWSLTKSD